ncbi:MAG: DUF3822 family protein [Bacteroidetes bacterium]|nr:DUF3822 family protein [Bacteroidota bacterium]MBS1930035.1 DUF3822 family protein [Bacteroidota bacterium]
MEKLFHVLAPIPPRAGGNAFVCTIGKKHCCFAVTDTSGKLLFELAYYTADEINGIFLNKLPELHPELNQPFQKVLVSYDHSRISIIPARQFRKENASIILNTLHGIDCSTIELSGYISESEMNIIYGVPREVHSWMFAKFPNAIYSHVYKSVIKTISKNDSAGCIRIDFCENQFCVIASKNNQLLLTQTFSYSTPDDVMYYLLKICQQFSLSPLEIPLVVSGLIEKQSALFHELYQYFIHVQFKNSEWIVHEDNEYPLHFFTVLNEIIQCES